MIRLAGITTALSLAVLAAAAPAALGSGLRFAVYGDMPYSDDDQSFLSGPASQKLAQDPSIAFVISVGDLGRPETACNDQWQLGQRALWRDGFRRPVFLTPGDNDWTDCDRKSVPNVGSELARLDALRRIHFSTPPEFVRWEWGYRMQPGQPENGTWVVEGVRFVTIHVVGTMNGREDINQDDRSLALALADARDEANRLWLLRSFAAARDAGEKAVVIAMQVDPFDPQYVDKGTVVPTDPLQRCLASAALAPTCRALAAEIQGFRGPVLLVHGDSSPACLEPIPVPGGEQRFWRLNAWGDFSKPSDMAIVDIDLTSRDTPFRVSGLVEGHQMPATCDYRPR